MKEVALSHVLTRVFDSSVIPRDSYFRRTITHLCRLFKHIVQSIKRKVKNPITGLDRPWGFQEVEAPRFQDNRHIKVVRLSALLSGRLYSLEVFLVLISVRRWVDSRGHSATGRIISMKNSNVTPSGFETVTFRLVAQCLNELRLSPMKNP